LQARSGQGLEKSGQRPVVSDQGKTIMMNC